MPRSEKANQRLREIVSARILDGARKAFARKGMAATMADVAAAARVSQGLAYRYFANKEAIIKALVEQTVQYDTGFQRFLEMPGTPGERLAWLVSRLVEVRRDYPELFQLMYKMVDDEASPNDLRDLMERQGQAFIDVLRLLIVEGQATGEIAADDPDQLVTTIMAYLDGLTRLALYDPERLRKQFPDPGIILRIFRPAAHKQQQDNPTGQKSEEGTDP